MEKTNVRALCSDRQVRYLWQCREPGKFCFTCKSAFSPGQDATAHGGRFDLVTRILHNPVFSCLQCFPIIKRWEPPEPPEPMLMASRR